MSQSSAISSRRTYNQSRGLTPEWAIPGSKPKSKDDLQVSTVTTTLLPIEQCASTSIGLYTYSSNNLEEHHLHRHSAATFTYGGGSAKDRSTLTAANICPSKMYIRTRYSTMRSFPSMEANI